MIQYLTYIILILSSTIVAAQNIQEDVTSINQDTIVSDTGKTETDGAVISFTNTSYNAGNVEEGFNLSYKFEFFNNGNEPLLITNVRASCSCTVASFPKTPVLPGNTGKISLELDTKNPGKFNKVVAVYSNAINNYDDSINKSRIILNISWTVEKKILTIKN